MKSKDIYLVVVVGIASAVLALVISNLLFSPKKHLQTAEVVEPISSDFTTPDKKYFNEQSIDPTQIIRIGDNSNQTPFNQTAQ